MTVKEMRLALETRRAFLITSDQLDQEPMSVAWYMPRTITFTCILFAATTMYAGRGLASDVDWKFYGGANPNGDGETVCFYDAQGITHQLDKNIRVWTKCLLQTEVKGFDIKTDIGKRIVDAAASKIAHYYMPPITRIETLNSDQSTSITMYEAVADLGDVEPRAKILYELSCSEKKERELSISVLVHGKHGDSETPSNWTFIPPESNGNRILKLLCSVQ